VTSAVANLTVVGPPVITSNPVALQLTAGAGGSLTARVRSTLQCSYQWKKNGVALANGTLYSGAAGTVAASATESTLTLGLFNASDLTPGTYTLTVTNAQGSVTSTGASVTVLFSKPKFLEAALVKAGTIVNLRSFADQTGPTLTEVVPSNDTLRVTVMASGTVTYEWRYATLNASTTPSVVLTGQTGASLDFSSSAVNKGPGYYLCRAASGTQATELRFLINSFAPPIAGGQTSVVGASLQIVSEPVSVSAGLGGVVLLDVSVTAGKRVYAWFKEGADGQSVLVSVGETGFLRLDPLTQAHAGAYFVVITDAEGNSLRSRTASVNVLSASD
jgi:hypothetical protein